MFALKQDFTQKGHFFIDYWALCGSKPFKPCEAIK